MNEKLMKKNGLTKDQFEPSEEQTTINDLVEALDVLTNIVLGEGDEDD